MLLGTSSYIKLTITIIIQLFLLQFESTCSFVLEKGMLKLKLGNPFG